MYVYISRMYHSCTIYSSSLLSTRVYTLYLVSIRLHKPLMNPIQQLMETAIQHEVSLNDNPYVTMRTITLRVVQKILNYTRVTFPFQQQHQEKVIFFSNWHEEILTAYESLCRKSPSSGNLSQDDKAAIERVLSSDHPSFYELGRFASCWYKHDRETVCKWFAVDGILGTHPKLYVGDAFCTEFYLHNSAVRELYKEFDADVVSEIVKRAFASLPKPDECEEDEREAFTPDPAIQQYVDAYLESVGKEEAMKVAADRFARVKVQKQQPGKRKRKSRQLEKNVVLSPTPSSQRSPVPLSPPLSPQSPTI